jgi:hypothetical protein
MNVEIGTEAAQFLEKEYKNGISLLCGNLATQLPAHQNSLMATRAIPCFCLSPGTAQRQRNPEVKRFIRATLLFSQHL